MKVRSSSRPRGQTLIEFAIILPVLLYLVVVIIDLGRAVYYYTVLTNAAREGARFASARVGATNGTILQHTKDYAFGVDLPDSGITVDKNSSTNVSIGGTTRTEVNVIIKISYDFVPITPYVDRLLNGGVINIKTEARMGREY